MIYSSELIKGTLKQLFLKLLATQKKMYGYEIAQRVKELTSDRIQITEGALYPTLHCNGGRRVGLLRRWNTSANGCENIINSAPQEKSKQRKR